jgi:hypothetical protein
MIGQEALVAPSAERFRQTGRNYPHPYLENWEQAPRLETPAEVIRDLHERFPNDQSRRMQGLYEHLQKHPPKLLPLTPDLVEFVNKLAASSGEGARELDAHGLNNIDYDIHRALLKAAGLDNEKWGICPVCKGECLDPAVQEAYESWKKEPPPEGPGWQLWETVSEGSPISPVFPTREAFIEYLLKEGYSQKAAEKFTEIGWVPSAATDGQGNLKATIHSLDDSP